MFTFEIIIYPRALMRGNPLQPHRLDSFGIKFPLHPCYHNFHYSHFCRQEKNRGGAAPISAILPPTFAPQLPPSPQLRWIPLKGKLHVVPQNSASSRASGGSLTLRFAKYFLRSLILLFLHFPQPASVIPPLRGSDAKDGRPRIWWW